MKKRSILANTNVGSRTFFWVNVYSDGDGLFYGKLWSTRGAARRAIRIAYPPPIARICVTKKPRKRKPREITQ